MAIIFGNSTNNTLNGFFSNDSLYGQAGDDSLYGQAGDDILYGQDGKDNLRGGGGADVLKGGNHSDKLFGNAGNDSLYGQAGKDNLRGGDGHDVLKGGNGHDSLYGGDDGDGDDLLNGGDDGDGDDYLEGGKGNDFLKGGDGSNILTGVNTNVAQPGSNEIDTLVGGTDDDLFILGDVDQVYYDDKLNDDYSLVVNFDSAQGDIIQLHGNANDYILEENVSGLPTGTTIILKTDGEEEVIGVVENVINMDLSNTEGFSYKNDDPDPPKPNNGNIAVNFQVDSKWYQGFTGKIILTNKGQEPIEGWTLAFDSPFTITSLWNAIQDSENGGNYQISNESWNAQILPNSSINFGFNGTR
ncbi:MAG: cellulose binding domain-containing protein, partial [Trichodesmium sp. St19_bin2]|nr:cellulose binding domain-containing protein [Trichodesmium sp. St19_bin2]